MLQFIILALCFNGGILTFPDRRIVGGAKGEIKNHPYQLSLHVSNKYKCGATIISPSWVITSAKCVNKIDQNVITLRAGSNSAVTGGTLHKVSKSIVHKDYKEGTHENDIALLQVNPVFVEKPGVSIVKLPLQDEIPQQGKNAFISGYGSTSPGSTVIPQALQSTQVPIVSDTVCKKTNPGITSKMLCAGFTTGGKDVCNGDEGSPLVLDGKLTGITSWNLACGKSSTLSVYTRVSSFRLWIKTNSGI